MADGPKLKTERKGYNSNYVASDKDRAQFMGSPQMDNMFTAMTAIAAEVWTVKRRLKIHESLLQKHGSITQAMIETYVPTEEENKTWQAERDTFAKMVYDPFLRPADIPHDASVTVPHRDRSS